MEQVKAYCSNFVYYRDDVLDDEKCKHLIDGLDNEIDFFENAVDAGFKQFGQAKLLREDRQIFLPQRLGDLYPIIHEAVVNELPNYAELVPSIERQILLSETAKLQKTMPSGGYHVWHHEQGAGAVSNRAMAWMIYLNDVESGGETEFLFQSLRVEPKKGRMAIWPAGITHPHRGNPPLSGVKYIATGWYTYPTQEYLDLFVSTVQG